MKILLYDDTPSYLCPGGKQVLAQKIYENLIFLGVDVEYARWWDPSQKCDLIHLFNCSPDMVRMARQIGVKTILTHIVDRTTNMSWLQRFYRRIGIGLFRTFLPGRILNLFPWHILPQIDALVYLHKFDAETAIKIYGAPRAKTNIIPPGCDAGIMQRLQNGPRNERSYLISIANIVHRKNTVLLAKAAVRAGVPIVFLGKPFNHEDEYYREFLGLVDGENVIYPGFVSEDEKIKWLTEASGFVLLSEAESGCIAVYEAAAAGLPLLLSNLPWSHVYGQNGTIHFVDLKDEMQISKGLNSFYTSSKRMVDYSFPMMTWAEIAKSYFDIYQKIISE